MQLKVTKLFNISDFLAAVLCMPQNVASLRHAYLVSFFFDPEDVLNLSTGAIWNFGKGTRLL